MESNKNKENYDVKLADIDNGYWLSKEYFLVKENFNGHKYYGIYTINPLMMSMIDDMSFAKILAEAMIQHGSRVFENFEEFLIFSKANL